nr:hypothetical protein [uncultured Neokomagataea sp.]
MLRFRTTSERFRLFLCLLQAVLMLFAGTPSYAAPHIAHHATSSAMMPMHTMGTMQECCSTHAMRDTSPHAQTPHTPGGHCGSCAHTACDTSTAMLPVTALATGLFFAQHQTLHSTQAVPTGSAARPDLPPPRTQTV